MITRVTVGEIDAVRMSVDDAVAVFRDSVIPALRDREGYEGVYVLVSDEGRMLALTFWETEEAAEASIAGGRSSYAQQSTVHDSLQIPSGRETYSVALAEPPPT